MYRACDGHTDGKTSDDPTIGACWDADRLDLCRLGDRIDVRALSTAPARTMGALNRARELLADAPEWETIFEGFTWGAAETASGQVGGQ